MPFCFKATRDILKTCAAVATLGAALAPSNAFAVTTWNWSFTTNISDQFGSGTFTTTDVVPTAGTTYQITGVSGTYNRGGIANAITSLQTDATNQFRWDGTSSSPILADFVEFIEFNLNGTTSEFVRLGQNNNVGFSAINIATTSFFGFDGDITSSTLAPSSPPSTAVPGPLPLLGAAAAFQASRRLRRRLKGSLPAAIGAHAGVDPLAPPSWGFLLPGCRTAPRHPVLIDPARPVA
jgi:hypothetical protein